MNLIAVPESGERKRNLTTSGLGEKEPQKWNCGIAISQTDSQTVSDSQTANVSGSHCNAQEFWVFSGLLGIAISQQTAKQSQTAKLSNTGYLQLTVHSFRQRPEAVAVWSRGAMICSRAMILEAASWNIAASKITAGAKLDDCFLQRSVWLDSG